FNPKLQRVERKKCNMSSLLRHRQQKHSEDDRQQYKYQPLPPYADKVYLARQKKPDPWWIVALEVSILLATICFGYYAYNHFDHLHFHVTKAYAHLGYEDAQHQVGQRYLHGKGVEQHHGEAMRWFKQAAERGHPHASYNVAVGHLKGLPSNLKPGEARKYLHRAAAKGHYSSSRYAQ
uniref:Sel1 repeat family protein n=1 Tax=Macrostomum lignano TaxID=282301 RepID=A0A1I8FF17_9PLAT